MSKNHNHSEAIRALADGQLVRRDSWGSESLFLFRQVPSTVPVTVIPEMSSLPPAAKHHFVKNGLPIHYSSQYALALTGSRVAGFRFYMADYDATDWEILESDPDAPVYGAAPVEETVGTSQTADSADLGPALAVLDIALATCVNNEPINRQEGNAAQADLELANIASITRAINILKSIK